MRKALITGIAGFAGSHLTECLGGRAQIWGTHIDGNLENLSSAKGVHLIKCDLLNFEQTSAAVKSAAPDVIFHLAAQSAPSLSIAKPAETLKNNIFSTLNVFEAASAFAPQAIIINAGSADAYGEVGQRDLPVKESARFDPVNPYAVSKATTDMMALQYFKSRGLRVIRCRPFNHIGPRQAPNFASPTFAKQIAEIEAGIKKDNVMHVGSLEAQRDFLDVRDVASAYDILSEKGVPGEAYNICSGKAIKIQEILDTLIGLSKVKIAVARDPSKMRRGDVKLIYGDNSKLKALGWSQKHDIKECLRTLLDYWRMKVSIKS
ncbi:MAG: GDP-mannose 4,6-dehydratase [Deltaproteobacteria bacterium]|nr:GDP-mannose 4,6-dehydratase [Deltaproteobacteria bacterium]